MQKQGFWEFSTSCETPNRQQGLIFLAARDLTNLSAKGFCQGEIPCSRRKLSASEAGAGVAACPGPAHSQAPPVSCRVLIYNGRKAIVCVTRHSHCLGTSLGSVCSLFKAQSTED